MAGKHRKPVEHNAARRATVAVTGAAILSAPGSSLAATLAPDEAFDLISECETGGRNVMNYINDGTHTAGGFWQITNTTWRANGGTEFAPTAIQATADQQRTVARRIATNGQANFGDWNESRHCWGARMPAALRGENVTAVHPGSVPAPPAAPPTAPPDPPVVAAAAAAPHVIQPGEMLSEIAKANGTTVEALMRLNPKIQHPDLIFAGETIVLSAPTYTVQPGDSLVKLAGDNWRALYEANQQVIGADPDRIMPGQQLVLVDSEGTNNLMGARPNVP